MKFLYATILGLAAFGTSASAAPVNLSSWTTEQGPGAQPPGNWSLAPDNNSVTQTVNSQMSVFYDGASSSQGKALSGTIRVNTRDDNDFVGFVLGMDAGEVDGSAAMVDYWLVSWKQGDQRYVNEDGEKGLALSHVTGATSDEGDFWGLTGVVDEKVRGATLFDTGWADQTTYNFELVFTEDLIRIVVNGALELSWSSAQNGAKFKDGGFGFYNHSQGDVTYAGIEEDPAPPVPLPAALPLLLAGLGALGILRRRQAPVV